MAEVTPDDVKLAISKAADRSVSIYRSVQMLYKMIFGSAMESHIIDENPCKNLNPKGGRAPKEKTALTDEQVLYSAGCYPRAASVSICYAVPIRGASS